MSRKQLNRFHSPPIEFVGMKQYLENETIRDKIVPYFKNKSKVVAAVCHGTIVLSRTIDNATGKSILYNRKSTCLPKYMER